MYFFVPVAARHDHCGTTRAKCERSELCENVAWLDKGILRAVGPSASVIAEYTGDTYEVQEDSETSIGKRWGSGRVSISTIELLNKNSQPSEVFDNGAPLTIRVSYSSHVPINDLVVSIRISTHVYIRGCCSCCCVYSLR